MATILGFGPSGERALPLAAGRKEGGHYFMYFLVILPPLFKITEGVVVWFHIFAWAPKKYKKSDPPWLPKTFFFFFKLGGQLEF